MTRWTQADVDAHRAKRGLPDVSTPPFALPSAAGRYALGRLPKGTMNKTEAAYAAHLKAREHEGEIAWFKFEPIKLRLADATFYQPDFMVLTRDGFLECHEVKGYWEDDARVKIKVAAKEYPFKFIGIQKDGKGWKREDFSR